MIKNKTKPFLKWAGGKTQMLDELTNYIPEKYNKYIEPFLGGGAMFFYIQPKNAILSDLNPELINCYITVRDRVEELIIALKKYSNDEELFYKIRSLKVENLNELDRAARFIFLNKTCFNGLYRENKKGEFNVPYGKNKNVNIANVDVLRNASLALANAKIICADYKYTLRRYSEKDDFVFLDPPYDAVNATSDFQRYTKHSFYDDDQINLRNEVNRLVKFGVKVLSTNSNTDFINELYSVYNRDVIETKRMISSKVDKRTGQDLIIHSLSSKKKVNTADELLENFPGTRYMGSKYKILHFLWDSIKGYDFDNVLDAFSGSGCVSYMLKQKGIEVYSNDFMTFSSNITKSLIENSNVKLTDKDLDFLLSKNKNSKNFILNTFGGLYFNDEDNRFLDNLLENINLIEDELKKSIAFSSISRACMKKRARGIFTYVGQRYDDGRRDLQLSLEEHFIENVENFNQAIFDNGRKNKSFNSDIFELDIKADLVYFDPPYLTSNSDNDYVRRYHFVEGLSKNWRGVEIQHETKTKKFKKYPSPFDSKNTVNEALDRMFNLHKNSILVVSYSSNSIPTKEEMIQLLKKYKSKVELKEIDYSYSIGNQNKNIGNNANKVKEYLFIAS
ncbi:Dam family site-specific DNA-(adenine-N6)-methyltransferase [Flavobacterium sp. MMS24-S5]|uniref:Dam family site-specific DNA-(adenine-N6)-methyltransferase n=1 Tax=Flavobacterium sp. MMS24-S5 TaxID=3416605 RepID=UPI003D002930